MLTSILHRVTGVGLYLGGLIAAAWAVALASGPEVYGTFMTLLGSPLSVLHDPDCLGLCQVCGTDLNVSTCAHQARVPTLNPEDIAQDADGSDLHATQNPFAALSNLDLPDE